MKVTFLYALPVVAFILCLTTPVFSGDPRKLYRSKQSRRQFRNRQLIARWLVGALLLATILTLLKPVAELPPALQGLVLLGIFCAPLLPVLLGIRLWRQYKDSGNPKRRVSDDQPSKMQAPDATEQATGTQASRHLRSDVATGNAMGNAVNVGSSLDLTAAGQANRQRAATTQPTVGTQAAGIQAKSNNLAQRPLTARTSQAATAVLAADSTANNVDLSTGQPHMGRVSLNADRPTGHKSYADTSQSQGADLTIDTSQLEIADLTIDTAQPDVTDLTIDTSQPEFSDLSIESIESEAADLTVNTAELAADQTLDATHLAEADQTIDTSSFLDQTLNADNLLDQTIDANANIDPDSTVSVHLENFDTVHGYHDVGVDEELAQNLPSTGRSNAQPPDPMQSSPVDTAIALAKRNFAEKHKSVNTDSGQYLSVTSPTELKQLVSALQSDKLKLQKLVIAQQAVIDSERQSHAKTRLVAKDAIKIMRGAREGQKVAEKLARRERAERLRIQGEYTKTRRALKNALSVARPEQPKASA